jgi:acyl carrier protein phosphodiesterase
MATVKECIARMSQHEAECALRYEAIERRLNDGSKRFDKLEKMLWAIYPFILGAIALAKFV